MQSGFDRSSGFQSSGDFGFGQSPFAAVSASSQQQQQQQQQDAFAIKAEERKKGKRNWERHVMLPLVITGYVQALFNVVVVVAVLCCFYWFASAIQQDIDLKVVLFGCVFILELTKLRRKVLEEK
jgi:hypothetical protein